MYFSFSRHKKQISSIPFMKKQLYIFSLLFLVITFNACEQIPDSIVDNKFVDYKVIKIEAPANFTYANPDSLFNAAISVQNSISVESAWLSIKQSDGTNFVVKRIELNKSSTAQNTTVYAAKVPMSRRTSSGKYLIEFFVSDNIRVAPENVSKVGEQALIFNNNQTNFAPVISDLVLTSSITRETPFTFTISVLDQNGLGDIAQVTFKLNRPDGTIVIPNPNTPNIDYFFMVDNGDANLGDTKAGDGIYSFKNTFGPTAQTGNWRFEFQAKDKSGAVSNIIRQTLGVN